MANDTSHIYTILVFFIILSVVLPITSLYFGGASIHNVVSSSAENNEPLNNYINGSVVEIDASSSNWDKVNKASKIFFWSFGDILWWVELFIIEPFRLLAYFIIYRLIRSGSG